MIQDPCKIGDSSNKIFSFRPNYSETGKIRLKPFVSDYNRVNNYLYNKNKELQKYPIKKSKILINSKSESIDNDLLDIKEQNIVNNPYTPEKRVNKYFYLQPVMKFAPRTEFERIFDTLNSYNYGSVDRNLILEQLKSLGYLTIQNNKNLENQNEYSLIKEKFKVNVQTLSYLIKEKERLESEPRTPQINELIANITEIIKINKEIKHDQERIKMPMLNNKNHKTLNVEKKKIINNYLAKNILADYQKKTHFKALLNFSLNLNEKDKKQRSSTINNRTYSNDLYNDKIKKNSIINYFNTSKKNIKKTCIKPFHKRKNYPTEDMEYLKELCLKGNPLHKPKNVHKVQNEDIDEDKSLLKPSNTIIINGVTYNKNKDLHKISKIILKECNYIKNYYNTEYAGEGKTMITRGLSVDEFTKKYGLPK